MLADARAAVRNSASRRVIGPVICVLKMRPLALPRDTTLPALRQAGTAYECPAEREKLAYEAQDNWLHLFGRNLEAELSAVPHLAAAHVRFFPHRLLHLSRPLIKKTQMSTR
jgi:hypothetical protein